MCFLWCDYSWCVFVMLWCDLWWCDVVYDVFVMSYDVLLVTTIWRCSKSPKIWVISILGIWFLLKITKCNGKWKRILLDMCIYMIKLWFCYKKHHFTSSNDESHHKHHRTHHKSHKTRIPHHNINAIFSFWKKFHFFCFYVANQCKKTPKIAFFLWF